MILIKIKIKVQLRLSKARGWAIFGKFVSKIVVRLSPQKIIKPCEKVDFGPVQKYVHLVGDLEKCCEMSVQLQIGIATDEKEPSDVCYKGLRPYNYNLWILYSEPSISFYAV